VADRGQRSVAKVATPAPIAELIAAWNDRSAERFAAAVAPDARVAVPPLHLELQGRDDVWRGVASIFGAFGALRYTMRHRYLSPDAVTDEVLLEGLQTQEFLGAPPTGHPGGVAARVMARHDGQVVTELTVWPDVAALREMSDGVARRIDLRAAGPAAPVVAALRASIPAAEAKFSVGHGRELPATAMAEVNSALLPGAPTPGGGIEHGDRSGRDARGSGHDKGRKRSAMPKAPVPRKVRRLRAFLAGIAMLALAGILVTYVVQGVNRTRDASASGATRGATPSKTSGATSGHPRSAGPGAAAGSGAGVVGGVETKPSSSSAKPSFDPQKNTYTFKNTVLFENDSARLRLDAQAALVQVIKALEGQKRYGTIIVTGYTDDTGTVAYNNRLSLRRAGVVAGFLRARLQGPFRVDERGLGEADPALPNTNDANREQNRRVEIKVPKPQG
jgi:outer membrane protein OmpA-like peptidoglycan-associated protein